MHTDCVLTSLGKLSSGYTKNFDLVILRTLCVVFNQNQQGSEVFDITLRHGHLSPV